MSSDIIENIDNNNEESEYVTVGASGDGLFGATAGDPADFVVHSSECQEHVKCGLLVAFNGPDKPYIEFDHLKDGDIAVTYTANVPGVYSLTMKYNDKHVKGSPFKINIISRGSPIMKPKVIKRNIVKKVKLSGPGMQEVRVGEIGEIFLDILHAEITCQLMVDILGPMEPKYSIVEIKNGTLALAYTPTEKGNYEFLLRFRGEHVPGSPFTVSVK